MNYFWAIIKTFQFTFLAWYRSVKYDLKNPGWRKNGEPTIWIYWNKNRIIDGKPNRMCNRDKQK